MRCSVNRVSGEEKPRNGRGVTGAARESRETVTGLTVARWRGAGMGGCNQSERAVETDGTARAGRSDARST